MARKATSQDVADLAGVSRTAVSLVLNGRAEGIVAAHKQALIIEAARQLRYRPDTVALSLRTRRTTTLALVADLADPQVGPILAGVVSAADQHGYMIMVLDIGGPDPFETSENRRVDGLIMVGPTPAAPDRPIGRLSTRPLPRDCPASFRISAAERGPGWSMCSTWVTGRSGSSATNERGYVNPGATASTRHSAPPRSRLSGGVQTTALLAAASATRGTVDETPRCDGARLPRATGWPSAPTWPPPNWGRGIPERLSVLGFDEDSSLVTGLAPPLSTIRLPRRELGERATDELHPGPGQWWRGSRAGRRR